MTGQPHVDKNRERFGFLAGRAQEFASASCPGARGRRRMPESEANGLQRIEHVVLMLEARLREDPAGMLHPAEARALTDLQGRMLAVDQAARERGHPAGQP